MPSHKPKPSRLSRRRLRRFKTKHAKLFVYGPAALALVAIIGVTTIALTRTHRPHGQVAGAKAEARLPSVPQRLLIPKLGIDVSIEPAALAKDGTMASPTTPDITAWFQLGPRPGAAGNAVIAGHLDGENFAPAVFQRLAELDPGDDIYVRDAGKSPWHFRVEHSQGYDARNAPLDKIFGTGTEPRLNLITCAGAWDKGRQEYNDRLVVFTKLVP